DDSIEPQRLADGPRLERAAARRVRRVAVGDLGKMAEARIVEMRENGVEKTGPRLPLRFDGAAANAYPGLHERSHEPWPHGALVVRRVALTHATRVTTRVARLVRRERAKAE